MTDALCIFMGILDFLAGIFILIGFGTNFFGLLLGILMIIKGSISFIN